MRIKALITLVVGKGVEILPNQTADLPETEAKRLIENGFAEELPKQTNSRKPPNPQKPIIPANIEDEIGDDLGENDDSDEQGGEQPV